MPFGEVIASSANPGIKLVRSLQRRKIRQQERAFIVEGLRAVDDVLAAGGIPRSVFLREDVDLEGMLSVPVGVPVRRVAAKLFDTLTDVPHPQGILAIVPMLAEPDVPVPDASFQPLVLIVDGVRDPGNIGTLLRSAAGAGVDHVVIAPETVDPYHPRAVRAAMGAYMRVPFSHRSWPYLAPILRRYRVIGLADADGDAVYDRVRWTSSSAIVIGGEAFGASVDARREATMRISIPLTGGVESLNAGVAGSLLLFEAARQRRAAWISGSG
jgi:RNA methyltransferase, TrmH family